MADVEKSVDEENLGHDGTAFSAYSGFDYGRYHNLYEVWFTSNDYLPIYLFLGWCTVRYLCYISSVEYQKKSLSNLCFCFAFDFSCYI